MSKLDSEFYNLLAVYLGVKDEATVKKWANAFASVIARELHYDGVCRVPGLGTFEAKIVGAMTQSHIVDGAIRTYAIPEHYKPSFTPSETLINNINDEYVAKQARRRIKVADLPASERKELMRIAARKQLGIARLEDQEGAEQDFQDLIKGLKDGKKDKQSADE